LNIKDLKKRQRELKDIILPAARADISQKQKQVAALEKELADLNYEIEVAQRQPTMRSCGIWSDIWGWTRPVSKTRY
jgi:hypothetical protein